MENMYVIDTETGPYDPTLKKHTDSWALEPYRDEFYIKLVGIVGPNGYKKILHSTSNNFYNDLVAELEFMHGKTVYCHNTIFDLSVLLSKTDKKILSGIKWRDTSLLAKWVNNSQKDERFVYSLRNCVEKWLPDNPLTPDFLDMKDNMEDEDDYWLDRVIKDCILTRDLAIKLHTILDPKQSTGYIIEANCLLPLAEGLMQGIEINHDVVDEMEIIYNAEVSRGLRELGITAAVAKSPKQLGNLLYKKWGLTPKSFTATGNPSTTASDLKYIALDTGDHRLLKLLSIKQKLTVISKYVNGFKKSKEYLNSKIIRPSPRLFNSYTGRMTYTSKLKKKYQIAIAFHQLPRKEKNVKRAIVAPKGYKFFYSDFAAQELRLMAQFSDDEVMLEAFNSGKDLHSTMTETIYGMPYEEIVEGNTNEVADIVDKRNCGKLTNLSSMYRIGAKSLQTKFFEQYDKLVTIRESTHYLNSYKRTFKGIPRYWAKAIDFARANGYAQSISNRRFGITNLDWKGESSSINFPIQGSGIDLSELVIALVHKEFPDVIFQLQVHDSLTWIIPNSLDPLKLKHFINNIDYGKYYETVPKLKFPLDCATGPNLADLKPL